MDERPSANEPAPPPEPRRGTLLRRGDQACAAAILALSLAIMAGYWMKEWGRRDDLIEVQREPPPPLNFSIDINTAPWTEFAALPAVGEVLAKRIVASRESQGPFRSHDDLRRVYGIGPRTLERMRPYLAPMPPWETVARE
jgi:competence protein ComEA